MAPRKPATAAEIVAILQEHPWIKKGWALPYDQAIDLLKAELHTTRRKAFEWLGAATYEAQHEFELIGTDGGRVMDVTRGGNPLNLHAAEYAGDNRAYWPHLSPEGELVRDGSEHLNEDFVVLSNDLRKLCERADKMAKQATQVKKRLRETSIRNAEKLHRDSIALFRGLLTMAGLQLDDDVFSARFQGTDKGGSTVLRLNLTDGNIDAVANVLSAHDIEPFPPDGAITRRPTTPDRAPEELDSV